MGVPGPQPFSPLLIGSMVETANTPMREMLVYAFSPLLIGSMVETITDAANVRKAYNFQSPFNRVNG